MPSPQEVETVRKRSSMRHWYPKLKAVEGVNTPDTEWVEIRDWEDAQEFTEGVPMGLIDDGEVIDAIESVGGPPAFIRSDQASHKHGMEKASKVTSTDPEHVHDHVFETLMFNELAGFEALPYTHLAVREWLDLKHEFTAFSGTPIASELRFFIRDGEAECYHFYWPAEAMRKPDAEDWEARLAQVRDHALAKADTEVRPLAERVAGEFDGYWSVDFAETVDGEWFAIDMAVGKASWHPECSFTQDAEPGGVGEK